MGGIGALHAAAGPVGLWLGDWGRAHERGASDRTALKDRLRLVRALLEHGADPNRRITASAAVLEYVVGRPQEGRFRAVLGRHRRPSGCHAAVGCGVRDQRGWGGQIAFLSDARPASDAEVVPHAFGVGR